MIREFFLAAFFSFTATTKDSCKQKSAPCFKGKLEIKAICSNYTISVLEGNLDTTLIVKNWQDESTRKQYQNVFKLGNPCTFPSTIKEGDEFYFVIDEQPKSDCAVCMAYYPTPEKKLSIKVIQKPCTQ